MIELFYFVKILYSDFKKIAVFIIFSILTAIFCVAIVLNLDSKNILTEKFDVGLVIQDENRYLDMLVEILFKREDLKSIIEFKTMKQDEAARAFSLDEIPCYIVIPSGFTDSVITGENKDIILYANKDHIISYTITDLLLKSGIAYLTSSQSGIYATIDYAMQNGVTLQTVDNSIVMPINLEFGKALLAYNNYYEKVLVYPTGALPVKTHYIFSFIIFFLMLVAINFYYPISDMTSSNIFERLHLIGYSKTKIIITLLFALTIAVFILSIPAIYFIGPKVIFLALNIASLILFSSMFFKEHTSFGVFMFTISFIMLFVSGGIIPKGLLPKIINDISFVTINHYFLFKYNLIPLIVYTVIFSSVMIAGSIYFYNQNTIEEVSGTSGFEG